MSSIVAEQYEFVIGVDTHAATHTFAVIAGTTGALLDHAVFPTSPAGLARAQSWLSRRVGDAPTLVVIEGTGSFGAILTARLQASGRQVVEAARMPANDRRGTGKSDELDAARIARAVLGLDAQNLRTPRTLATDQARVAMRVLVVARDQMTGEKTRAINALIALVRTIDLVSMPASPSPLRRSPPSPPGAIVTKTPPPQPAVTRPCVWPDASEPSTLT
jgi:transposase